MMIRLTISTPASNTPPWRSPAITPNPTPSSASTASAINASLKVTGNACARTVVTGNPE
jgi:hypothetical protein